MRFEREIVQFIEGAAHAAGRDQVARASLDLLSRLVGLDTGIVFSPRAAHAHHVSIGKDPSRIARFASRRPGYDRTVAVLVAAARQAGGVAIDTDVLSARERDRLPVFAEYLRTMGTPSTATIALTRGGAAHDVVSIVRFGRHGFDVRDLERLRRAVPALSLALRLFPADAGVALDPTPELTAREREIAHYVCRGLTNPEIARLCGTSLHTVRNQLAAMFRKLDGS